MTTLMKGSKGLKGLFAKNERGYRLMAKNKRFWSLIILLLSVASVRRKLLKTTYTEERNVHTNSESCNIQQKNRNIFSIPRFNLSQPSRSAWPRNCLNPISAGVLENQDKLGGGLILHPPSKPHVWCPNMTNETSLESSYALLLESAKKISISLIKFFKMIHSS